MADTNEQFPSDALLARANEYRDIQEEVAELFFKHGKSIKNIACVEDLINKGLVQRLSRQRDLIDLIKKSKDDLLTAEKNTQLAAGANKVRAKTAERAARQQLRDLQGEFDILTKINRQAMLPWIYLLEKAWGLFVSMDKSAESFRMKMGMFRGNMSDIRASAQKLAIDFMHVGMTINGAYEAMGALGKEMGGIRVVTQDLVKITALLKAQLGVAEEDSAGFFRNMAAVSKSTMQAQEDMAYMAQDLAQAAGVPLPQIMNDVAKMSSQTLTMVSRVPNQILRAAIEARRMNTSLSDMARSGREILNFSDNINAEMEASVLLGRSINLQRARQLAYNRDLVGSTKEILRITRNINFENLDVFQQEAFARATGKSVDELMRMVQAEKQWDDARRSSDPKIRAQVEQYDKLLKLNEASAKARAKDVGLMVQQQANQQRLTSISNKWNQILAQASQLLLPIVDALLSAVLPAMDIARGIAAWSGGFILAKKIGEAVAGIITLGQKIAGLGKTIQDVVVLLRFPMLWTVGDKIRSIGSAIAKWQHGVGLFVSPLVKVFSSIGKFFTPIVKVFATIGKVVAAIEIGISKLVGPVLKFIGPLLRFAAPFMRFIPILGLIITGFQFLVSLVTRFREFVGKDGILLGGLKAIGYALYDVLIAPFVSAWKWVKSLWGGNSPSQVGLSILKGIVSIGAMLYDALTSPFRRGLAWIMDKIPGMSKVAEKLRGGVSGMINKPVETRAAAAYVPAVTVTPNGIRVAGAPGTIKTGDTTPDKKETINSDKLLQDILTAINTLNSNLVAGKIGINMDGQLLSATLSRQTDFRGGYGVNKV